MLGLLLKARSADNGSRAGLPPDRPPEPMLRVLSHYLPLRTALLVLSEILIVWTILSLVTTQHLWGALEGLSDPEHEGVGRLLARRNLTADDALVRCLTSSLGLTFLTVIAIGFNQLYEPRVTGSRYARAARFVESAGTAIGLTVAAIFLTHQWGLERALDFPGITLSQRAQMTVFALVGAFVILYGWRIAYHRGLQRMQLHRRVLILGSRGPAHALTRQILDHPGSGYQVAGMLPEPEAVESVHGDSRFGSGRTPVSSDHGPTPETERLVLSDETLLLSGYENSGAAMGNRLRSTQADNPLLALIRKERVDTVVVALENRREVLPTDDLLRCRLAGIDVREREGLYEEITGKLAVEAMRPSYLIFNEGFGRHPIAAFAKRTTDILLSVVIFALTWPLMIISALMVRFDTPGSVLFKQQRVGQDGKLFTLIKFRSMSADAEKHTGPIWSQEGDPRITRSGSFMRKTRLDELPQLFNVLAGSMSLVGPRPERQVFVDELAKQIPYFDHRHIVKPGLTGWAQINYPYGNTTEDALHKLQYDLFYIKSQSLIFDLSILFNTIKTVVLRQGT
ncbi:MAG: lipopolysaccharide/colanic/teichoic acid biosynthesis glycosyltransferase [Planctomycetota bacterium]|jgi:lipopolysaccharide/colanic/teichoic acid biosynthesis glycosyltransferase